MRHIKKAITATLLSACSLLALSACSSKTQPIADDIPSDRFVIWSTESDPGAQAVLKNIELQLEQKHTGTDVVVETVGWGDVSERLINARNERDYPDVSHIQPFMAYSLYSRDLLLPVTNVRAKLEEDYGPILPAIRNLQEFDGQVYGIAYAVGTTFWSIRADMIPDGLDVSEIETWEDYLNFIRMANEGRDAGAKVTLPGGSPFFIDQLFGELVANADGKLFDDLGCPTLTSTAVIKTLNFFEDLNDSGALASDWASQTYTDQFSELARGDVFSVPVTYARASRTVIETFRNDPILDVNDVSDELVYWLQQPVAEAGLTPIATIDAEPWVVFKSSASRVQRDGVNNDQIAKDFLELFYQPKNYDLYTEAVPVHLTPIFERMANSPRYISATVPFTDWHVNTLTHLRSGTTRPILMPDISQSGKSLPFLLEFQRAGILSGAVSDVIESGASPEKAAIRAQTRAIQIVQRHSDEYTCKVK